MVPGRRSGDRKRYPTTAVQDVPDLRDWPYEPTLKRLSRYIAPPRGLAILDQAQEGACTGFGLAAAINLLNKRRGSRVRVSPRMLYEMAKLHDEWPGEGYAGSSCRGAIKGWFNMGVCADSKWPYVPYRPGVLTVARAEDARANTVGAYYRIQPRVSDFHAALNEAGVIFCSAKAHNGWMRASRSTGTIPFVQGRQGAHAFAIVGYNSKGFWIQNSWGRDWGKGGLGLWQYEDWLDNVLDAWVVSLALPTPQIWHLPQTRRRGRSGMVHSPNPARSEIAGHFMHVDDGRFQTRGRYWSSPDDVRATARLVAGSRGSYQHLLLYAHGGLNSPPASARRIAALKETFKRNGIYPYHFMYDTGILEELKDVVSRRGPQIEGRAGGIADWSDRLIEWGTRIPGRALWREMKDGARLPFLPQGAGSQTLAIWLNEMARRNGAGLRVHLCGHSTGAILLARLLETLEDLAPTLRIHSCTLLAPAASVALFQSHYYPYLVSPPDAFGLDRLQVLNLTDRLERDDQVGQVYRKSLLYLVSRAFEEEPPEPILGMQRHMEVLLQQPKMAQVADRFAVHYSDGRPDATTESTTHDGFDNDVATMNTLLRTILGREPDPDRVFQAQTLDY